MKPDVLVSHSPPHSVEAELAARLPQAGVGSLAGRLAGPLAARWVLRLIPLVLLAAAMVVLWREFHDISLAQLAAAMDAWDDGAVAGVLALAAASFFLMGVIEWLALRWTGARLPWRAAMGGSFVANATAHALGANLLVSGALRARLYKPHGVSLTQIAAITLFGGATFAVGLSALSGTGLLMASPADLEATAIPLFAARILGGLLLALSLGYVAVCAHIRGPLTVFGHSLTLPKWRDAIAQLMVGVVDNGIAAAIIWTLLPDGSTSYPSFIGAYAIACVTGLASSVPGGAGVFESALASLLPAADDAALAAAFLGYRLGYYILPLMIATAALTAVALRRRGDIGSA